MSFKAKNLEYQANEPAFLRRIREQHSGGDGDRHERPIARPKRAKANDEDDGPTYVDESNDTLTKAEYEALVAEERSNEDLAKDGEETLGITGKSVEDGPKASGALPDESSGKGDDSTKKTQNIAEAGIGTKKRKAKVVGNKDGGDRDQDDSDEPKANVKKAKKKSKPVKLSFDDD